MSQQSSQLSRSRTAVLVITGIAAACGIYVLCNTFSEQQPKSALRRSNAIYRRRPQHRPQLGRPKVGWIPPFENALLGSILIRWGNTSNVHSVNMAADGIPALDDLSFFLQGAENDPEWVHYFHVAAVECVLHAATHPYTQRMALEEWHRLEMAQNNLQWIPRFGEVVLGGELNEVLEFSSKVRSALHSRVSTDEVHEGISKFTGSEPVLDYGLGTAARYFASDAIVFADPDENEADDDTFAETEETAEPDETTASPGQGFMGMLYHIAEAEAKRKAYEHRGIHCEECGERPIRGVRWHCLNCPDFDLCSTCEATTEHQKTHVFVKIKIPLPVLSQPTKEYPLWYPGDPRKFHPPLNGDLRTRLGTEYNFDDPQMDANYDQFTCMANVPWNSDPNGVMGAIDRRAFNKALTSERWPQRFRPNALYDRMFAFYDTNNDGLIGFEEFVSGIAYLRGSHRFTPLRRALRGFDIDGDGYIDRRDFLRLFRAKYEIQKLVISSLIERREEEQTSAAMDTLRSSLPISSIFSVEEIPPGEERPRGGKTTDSFGDMQPSMETNTILGDYEGWSDEQLTVVRRRSERNGAIIQPHERLEHHLSRFEELLHTPTDDVDGPSNGGGTDDNPAARFQHDRSVVDGDVRRRSNVEDRTHTHGTNKDDGEDEDEGEDENDDEDEDEDEDEPLNQNILWQIVEDAFHEMLDPLLKAKEAHDQEVVESRAERKKWRKEIDEAVQEKESFQEETKLGTEANPLIIAKMTMVDRGNKKPPYRPNPETRTEFVGGLVPTDPISLERREAEISRQPLEDLLDATGYSMNETDADHNVDSLREDTSLEEDVVPLSTIDSISDQSPKESSAASTTFEFGVLRSDSSPDPTMPQNRPNSDTQNPALPAKGGNGASTSDRETEHSEEWSEPVSKEKPPLKERLEYLASLDEQDRELRARGGPGKLSFEEIEEIVKADTTKELKGLVTGWLEWASF